MYYQPAGEEGGVKTKGQEEEEGKGGKVEGGGKEGGGEEGGGGGGGEGGGKERRQKNKKEKGENERKGKGVSPHLVSGMRVEGSVSQHPLNSVLTTEE